MSEQETRDLIEMTDDEGNTLQLEVIDYFFYNGEEYVILGDTLREEQDLSEDENVQIDCYIMRVLTSEEDGEEMEEFVPIEDEDLERRLIEIATTRLDDEDEEEE